LKYDSGWVQFKAEISEEVSRGQDERIVEWRVYQEEKQAEKEREHKEETRRNFEDEPICKCTRTHLIDLPSPSPKAQPMSPQNLLSLPTPFKASVLPPRPLNPQLTDEERKVKDVLENRYLGVQTDGSASLDGQMIIE